MHTNESIVNDWRPEVGSLIREFKRSGWSLVYADNGEDHLFYRRRQYGNATVNHFFKRPGCTLNGGGTLAEVIECACACDESTLYFENKDGKRVSCFIVLGNAPGELAADGSAPAELLEELIAIMGRHSDRWEGRKQPVRLSYWDGHTITYKPLPHAGYVPAGIKFIKD